MAKKKTIQFKELFDKDDAAPKTFTAMVFEEIPVKTKPVQEKGLSKSIPGPKRLADIPKRKR